MIFKYRPRERNVHEERSRKPAESWKTRRGEGELKDLGAYLENADEKDCDSAGKSHVDHSQRNGERKIEISWRKNPLRMVKNRKYVRTAHRQ